MKFRVPLFSAIFGFSLILVACSEEETSQLIANTQPLEESKPTAPAIDREYDFTYLEDLSEEKRSLYDKFLINGDIANLQAFTPEEMVLLKMNLIFEHNIDKLYNITYNNNQLPEKEIFIDMYEKYLEFEFMQDYLMYRYYDKISIDENTSTDDRAIVQLEIICGSYHYLKTFPVLKEGGIWKVDLYNYMKEKSEQ